MIYFLHRFAKGGPPYDPLLGPHLRYCCCLHLVDCCAIVAAAIAVPIAATATATVTIIKSSTMSVTTLILCQIV
jgi:hypothetical protein